MAHYLVFARKRYDEPLGYQGALEAVSEDAAQTQAREQFGAQWLEVVLAPEDAIFWLLRPEAELEALP